MFNPCFVLNVKNNFGKLFFKIVKKKFRKLILYQRSSTKTQLKLVTVVLEIKSLKYQVIANKCCIQNLKQKNAIVKTKMRVH